MVMLADTLKNFSSAFSKGKLNHGKVYYREHISISGPFPLGPALHEYYSHLDMADSPAVGGAMQLQLFELNRIESAQAGWRWIRDKSGNTIENKNWQENWVIFADRNGDALFVDTQTEFGTVYGSIQQRNFLVSNTLSSFLEAQAACMAIEADEFNYDVYDDDFNPIDTFMSKIEKASADALDSNAHPGFIKFFFG